MKAMQELDAEFAQINKKGQRNQGTQKDHPIMPVFFLIVI